MKFNFVLTIATLVFCFGAYSAETDSKQEMAHAPSKEAREQMAQTHEKMAACLRSEASIHDCHQQMMDSCKGKKEEGSCHMMDGMMGKHKKSVPSEKK